MPCWVCKRQVSVSLALFCQREVETPRVQQVFVRPPIDYESVPSNVVDHGVAELHFMVVDPYCPQHCWVVVWLRRGKCLRGL